jgi:hypothetical protein
MKKIVFVATIVSLAFSSLNVHAQNAIVNNDLSFGDIFPGIPKTISKTTPGSAAEFFISGTAGSEVAIDFSLPTYMNSGGHNMQMVFRETDCALDSSATPDQTNPGSNNLDPWHTITYRLGSNGLTVWLGGMVVPKLMQKKGSYSAVIVLTVAYTGN